ncbi:hypothetical protein P692DRAFT_20930996, partial [Suillus brevipes Sb2]
MEFFDYRRVGVDTSIVVDRSRGQKLSVRLNVTFPHVPCYLLSLDVMGISGEQQRDISHNILKKRITPTGVDMPASRARTSAMISTSLLNDARTGIVARAMVESRQQAYTDKGWSFGNPDGIEQ